jgi:hypothetical protein
VIRFILSCLVALSLIGGAPAVAAMAEPSPASQASDCTMSGGGMPDQPADQDKMPCCTGDCTMAGTVGLPLSNSAGIDELQPTKAALAIGPVHELDSLEWATVDPPPRA